MPIYVRNCLSFKVIIAETQKTCLAKVADHFLYEGPHRCNVDYLEFFSVDCSVLTDVFANLSQHCQQCYIRLTSTLHTLLTHVRVKQSLISCSTDNGSLQRRVFSRCN